MPAPAIELHLDNEGNGHITVGDLKVPTHFSWDSCEYAEEEVEKNPGGLPSEWATASISTTGRAMAGAAVTTAGGFSVLNLSSLVPLQLFGQAFVVAITLALLEGRGANA